MADLEKFEILFCPNCNYNLTGLTELRCPECGTGFDREALLRLSRAAPRTISLPAVLVQLLWPPLAFAILGFLLAVANVGWLYATLILAIAIYALLAGIELAQRIFATLSVRCGGSRYFQGSRNRLLATAIVIILFEWIMCFGGCRAGAALGHRLF